MKCIFDSAATGPPLLGAREAGAMTWKNPADEITPGGISPICREQCAVAVEWQKIRDAPIQVVGIWHSRVMVEVSWRQARETMARRPRMADGGA